MLKAEIPKETCLIVRGSQLLCVLPQEFQAGE
jgi:hypothetical protein